MAAGINYESKIMNATVVFYAKDKLVLSALTKIEMLYKRHKEISQK